jgi:hypothetical protein
MDLPTKRKIYLDRIGPNIIFLIFNVIDTDRYFTQHWRTICQYEFMGNIIWHREVIFCSLNEN